MNVMLTECSRQGGKLEETQMPGALTVKNKGPTAKNPELNLVMVY